VHYGRAEVIHLQRTRVLAAAYLLHPERFVRKTPEPPALPVTAWINKPDDAATQLPLFLHCPEPPPDGAGLRLTEYGKLLRTLHALRWFTDEAFRRRIGRQLNRGEATNDLRRFIFFANRGAVRYPHHDDQTTQAHCHTLVNNACVLSTTGYLEDAIHAQQADGHQISEEAKAHMSVAHFEAINPYGTLISDIASVLKRSRRPLRRL